MILSERSPDSNVFWRLIPELVKCQQLNMTTCMEVSPVLRPYCCAFEARDAGGVEDEGEVADAPDRARRSDASSSAPV